MHVPRALHCSLSRVPSSLSACLPLCASSFFSFVRVCCQTHVCCFCCMLLACTRTCESYCSLLQRAHSCICLRTVTMSARAEPSEWSARARWHRGASVGAGAADMHATHCASHTHGQRHQGSQSAEGEGEGERGERRVSGTARTLRRRVCACECASERELRELRAQLGCVPPLCQLPPRASLSPLLACSYPLSRL